MQRLLLIKKVDGVPGDLILTFQEEQIQMLGNFVRLTARARRVTLW